MEHVPVKKKGILDLEARKRTAMIASLESIFEYIARTFHTAHCLYEVVILLGGTTVSPKETYVIKLPTAMYDGKLFTLQQAKSSLFRQLITNQCWTEIPEMRPTKMHILVHAVRDDELSRQGLKPRLTFKVPTKGRVFNINLGCKCTIVSSELSKLGDTEFEISGVEPLDISGTEFMDNNTSYHIPQTNGNMQGRMDTDSCATDDFIWYQLPTTAQGLKIKSKS